MQHYYTLFPLAFYQGSMPDLGSITYNFFPNFHSFLVIQTSVPSL